MKFSGAFLFASLAFAAPQLAPRQEDVVGTITDSVKTLDDATSKSFDEIKNAVDSVEDNDSAEVEATLKNNYQAILSAFEDATGSVADVSTDDVNGLSEQQLDQLAEAVEATERIVKGLEATVKLSDTDLTPELMDAIQGDVDAAKGAVGPFVEPLTAFAEAASKAGAASGVAVDGLQDALEQVDGVLKGVAESLGISELDGIVNLDGIVDGK